MKGPRSKQAHAEKLRANNDPVWQSSTMKKPPCPRNTQMRVWERYEKMAKEVHQTHKSSQEVQKARHRRLNTGNFLQNKPILQKGVSGEKLDEIM